MPSWSCSNNRRMTYRAAVLPPDVTTARRGRTGLDPRLGAVHGVARYDHRHEDLRASAPFKGIAGQVRVHLATTSTSAAKQQLARKEH